MKIAAFNKTLKVLLPLGISSFVKAEKIDPYNIQLPENPLPEKQIGDWQLNAKIRYDTFQVKGLKNLKITQLEFLDDTTVSPKYFPTEAKGTANIELSIKDADANPLSIFANLCFIATGQSAHQNATYSIRLSSNIEARATIMNPAVSGKVYADLSLSILYPIKVKESRFEALQIDYDEIHIHVEQLGPFAQYADEIIDKFAQTCKAQIIALVMSH